MSWHLSTPLSVEIYWTSIYRYCAIRFSFLSISLSIDSYFHLPNLSHSLQTSSSRFLQAFTGFSSVGKLRISHLHAFHVLKPRFWGIWKILGFFKIDEFLLKFGLGFSLHEFKISCIAFHVHYNCIFMHLVVCYTCWTACVLVGLDWAEPMMKFLLHVTCSCISHAYVLYFQYTCYIWNASGLF